MKTGSPFTVSEPLMRMLDVAGFDPARLNRAIDRRLLRGRSAEMYKVDYYPRGLASATGMAVHRLSRAHRNILLKIDMPTYRYEEHSRNDCRLFCKARLPETIQAALIGKTVSDMASFSIGGFALADLPIENFLPDYGPWTVLKVTPEWRRLS
ncbi:hypothetical protein BH10PSE14_BH10PSE14_35200 [soil metagenome]